MYKTQNCWNSSATHQDSESEGGPVLSSGSHASTEPVMFHDSETSDVDSNPRESCSRYGSASTGSYNSTVTVIPKRLPPLIQDSGLIMSPSSNRSCTLTTMSDKCYEVRNIDMMLVNEKYDTNAMQPAIKEFTTPFLPGSFPVEQNVEQRPLISTKSKQNSLVTIFSVWNTILGSSLLTMPWGIAMAGFIPGMVLILAMSGLCLYTAYRLLFVHRYYGGCEKVEVIQLSRIYLNKWAENAARIFSITVLLGATIAYWVLMSNFLYNSVNFFYDNIANVPRTAFTNDTNTPEVLCPKREFDNDNNTITLYDRTYDVLGPSWDLNRTVPVFLALLIFPLLNFNSTTFFTKFNSLGTASIIYLIIFVIVKSASWGINMSKAEWEVSWMLRPTFPALSGMLALSFFIHNIIITIMQSNRDQSKNGRDLTIAYILVTITYVLVGAVFFICFPLPKSCIEDNLLNNFQKWDGLTVGARIVLLFQLFTVYPLLAYMLRIQLLSSLCKVVSTRSWTLIINLAVVSICILFAAFVPRIGTIIRYTGALSGLVYVFTLPSLLHLAVLKKQNRLTIVSLILHLSIPLIGCLNLIAQFLISDH